MANVIVYSTATWGSCKAVKEFLTAKGVPFTNRNIAEDEKAMKELQKLGVSQTPAILVDGEVILGFDRTKLRKALGLSWESCATDAAER